MGRLHIASVVAACLCAALAGAPRAAPPGKTRLPAPLRASRLERQAASMVKRRRPAEAAALYRQAAVLRSDDFGAWEQAGWTFVDAGMPTEGLAAFAQVIELTPGTGHGEGGRLICWYLLRRGGPLLAALKQRTAPAEAQRAVAAGLRAREATTARAFGLAALYGVIGGGGRRALAPLRLVTRAQPSNAYAWLLLADLAGDLNLEATEQEATRRYLRLAPKSEDAYRLRALAF